MPGEILADPPGERSCVRFLDKRSPRLIVSLWGLRLPLEAACRRIAS
jgi:hypothetical protein